LVIAVGATQALIPGDGTVIGQAGKGDVEAIVDARRALAKANAQEDSDRAAHSPSCVASDQKLVDLAQQQLAALAAQAQSAGVLDITA
jgi:hypothetical protein